MYTFLSFKTIPKYTNQTGKPIQNYTLIRYRKNKYKLIIV